MIKIRFLLGKVPKRNQHCQVDFSPFRHPPCRMDSNNHKSLTFHKKYPILLSKKQQRQKGAPGNLLIFHYFYCSMKLLHIPGAKYRAISPGHHQPMRTELSTLKSEVWFHFISMAAKALSNAQSFTRIFIILAQNNSTNDLSDVWA